MKKVKEFVNKLKMRIKTINTIDFNVFNAIHDLASDYNYIKRKKQRSISRINDKKGYFNKKFCTSGIIE